MKSLAEFLKVFMKVPELRTSVRITTENQTEADIHVDSVRFLPRHSNSQFF